MERRMRKQRYRYFYGYRCLWQCFDTTSGVFTISDTTPPVIIAGTNGTSECQGNNPDVNTDYLAWLAANGGATASDLCGNAISWTMLRAHGVAVV